MSLIYISNFRDHINKKLFKLILNTLEINKRRSAKLMIQGATEMSSAFEAVTSAAQVNKSKSVW